jgi:exosortase
MARCIQRKAPALEKNHNLTQLHTPMPPHRKRLLLFAVLIAIALPFFWPALSRVVISVLHREGSSHGFFAPFLSAYFLWLKREQLSKIILKTDLIGLPLVLICPLFSFFRIGSFHVSFILFICYAAFLVLLVFGREIFKKVAFPIFFLVVMTPVSGESYNEMADLTRYITLKVSLVFLTIFQIPFFRDGWHVQLPNANLVVDTSCSGIRYLVSYFVFGLAYSHLFKETVLSKVGFVLSTVPFSLFASSIRLTVIFVLTYLFGPQMAEYWPHVILSWFVFIIFLILGIGFDQYLGKRKQKRL